MLAQAAEVRIASQPFEIAIAEAEGLLESNSGEVELANQRVTAGEIIKNQRVAWFEPGQLLIDFETVAVTATLSVVVSQDLQGLDILRFAADDTFHERDFDIEITEFFAGQLLIFGTAFLRHKTVRIVPKRPQQVKCAARAVPYEYFSRGLCGFSEETRADDG